MSHQPAICQVAHHNTDLLNCPARESGGNRCERTGVHTDHWISPHTIAHERWGSGYPCGAVDAWLDQQIPLWEPRQPE